MTTKTKYTVSGGKVRAGFLTLEEASAFATAQSEANVGIQFNVYRGTNLLGKSPRFSAFIRRTA